MNEVVDGDGTSLAGWTITDNNGNGWVANGAFRTSYGWDRKFQVIDLVAAGYTTAVLDTAPIVYASEQYSSIVNNGDEYEYTVTLQDAAFNTIETRSISLANVGSNAWQVAAFTFSNYGAGLRYIRYEHGGKDSEWWAGHYGTRIDNSTINLNTKGNISTGSFSYNCPLPVILNYFNGKCENKSVQLNWSTSTEINNDYFTIEKSYDAISFEEVATIQGNGNSNILNNYSWSDDNPSNQNNYYRLKQTDFDGKYNYYNTISITNCNENIEVSIYPNPFNDILMVSLPENSEQSFKIKIQDYLGRTLIEKPLSGTSAIKKIDASLLKSKGIYFITISDNTNTIIHHQKLIKQ